MDSWHGRNDASVMLVTEDSGLERVVGKLVEDLGRAHAKDIRLQSVAYADAPDLMRQHAPDVALYDYGQTRTGAELLRHRGESTRVVALIDDQNRNQEMKAATHAINTGFHDYVNRPKFTEGISADLFEIKLYRNIADSITTSMIGVDDMTGLKKNVTFKKDLEKAMFLVKRRLEQYDEPKERKTNLSDLPPSLTLAYVDADDFKSINDTFGHCAGDDVLMFYSRMLSGDMVTDINGEHIESPLRRYETIGRLTGRLGGDEFGIIFNGNHNYEAMTRRLTEVSRKLSAQDLRMVSPALYANSEMPIKRGMSIGFVTYPYIAEITGPQQMMDMADTAMYAAKERRKALGSGYADSVVATYQPGNSNPMIIKGA